METKILRKTALFGGILLIGILIMGQSAMAAKWADTPSGQDCVITEAFVNFNAENDPITVNIYGRNFECENLIVTLGDLGQLHQNFRPLKIKQLRNTAGYLSVLIFETVFVTY